MKRTMLLGFLVLIVFLCSSCTTLAAGDMDESSFQDESIYIDFSLLDEPCECWDYYEVLDENLNVDDPDAEWVSIIRLIVNPSDYHGKKVRVYGIGRLQFEGNGLYLSVDDYIYGIHKNGLWIELGKYATPLELAERCNGRYVIVEGTFDMEHTGHFGFWSGAILDITLYMPWHY
jgi:hypothetical protein